MEKKKVITTLVIIMLFLAVASFFFLFGKHILPTKWHSSLKSTDKNKSEEASLANIRALHEKIANFPKVRLSRKEYEEYKATFSSLVKKENPTVALQQLARLRTEGKISIDCHNLTHEIGRAAYEKYQDSVAAFRYKMQVCGFGYVHGVIESYVENTADAIGTMQTLCQRYPVRLDELECYHAIGHSLMIYYGNDVPLAINICDQYSDDTAKSACGLGVFMENFSSDEDHPSEFVSPDDPFYPCQEQKDVYKPNCYKMAPFYYLKLHDDDYRDILSWCATESVHLSGWCTRGVILQIAQYNVGIKILEQFCFSGAKEQAFPCIHEVVRNQILYHPKSVPDICKKFEYPLGQEYCKKAMPLDDGPSI